MITIISCTNRQPSNSTTVAKHYEQVLRDCTEEEIIRLDLADVPMSAYANDAYSRDALSDSLKQIMAEMIIPAEKFIFIVPEYNGGMPGVLKLFIDSMSVGEIKDVFHMKKACLTGISSGRAGNLRGMEHLTGVLNYLQVVVFPNRLPISGIESLVNDSGAISDDNTIEVIKNQINSFLEF